MNISINNGVCCVDKGEEDFMKEEGIALLDAFVDPLVIRHPKGHTVPKRG